MCRYVYGVYLYQIPNLLINSIQHRAKVKLSTATMLLCAVCKIITSSEVAYFSQNQFPYVISDPQNKWRWCSSHFKCSLVRHVVITDRRKFKYGATVPTIDIVFIPGFVKIG